jgi:VanZ family protein
VRRWTRVKNWLPAIVWACVISALSTDSFSSERTSAFLTPVLHWLFPQAGLETIELMNAIIRKSAHFTEYFVLSIFLIHGLRGGNRRWQLRWAVWAVAIAAGYAALDEFHQSFVPSRTASPWDALLDTVGASAAQVFLWLWKVSRVGVTSAKIIPNTESHTEHPE